jgi:putative transposon-encoded protein
MKKEKPQITTFEGKEVVHFRTTKEVKKFGGSAGHIIVPKGLVGKGVEIYYLKKREEKNDR